MMRRTILASLIAGIALARPALGAEAVSPIALAPRAPLAQAAPAALPAAESVKPPAPVPSLDLDASEIALGGMLKNPAFWAAYKARFVTEQGRVIDTANGLISHSEGQGYGMLLAVAANDRQAFERIWAWTRANLLVRNDELMAWRFDPDKRPGVSDTNNASDGDILIAWALTEAAEFWADGGYRVAGRRIAVEVERKVVIYKTAMGSLILPGVAGFSAKEQKGAPVLNLSYYIYPAFSRLHIVAPEIDWSGMTDSGLDLLGAAQSGPAKLPPEWVEVRGKQVTPAPGYPATFGYNAIRIPLYMAWAGVGERVHYAPFAKLWSETLRGQMAVMDTKTGSSIEIMTEPGYRAIAALTACVVAGTKLPPETGVSLANENYYPATLGALSIIATQMRFPSCVQG